MNYVFDEKILLKVAEFEVPSSYSDYNPLSSGSNFILRPLEIEDYDKGIYDVLKFLTEIGEISKEKFTDYFNKMKNASNSYFVVVIEDMTNNKIAACGSLILQYGFFRGCSKRGCIEDIAVRGEYQGKQLGKAVLNTLVVLGRLVGCYKLNLHCTSEKTSFYEKFGFQIRNNNMSLML